MAENEKKKPDYTNSAENLTNDYRLGDLLSRLHAQQENLAKYCEERDAVIPDELKEKIYCTEEMVKNLNDDIRQTIDEFGSYQDIEQGWYAVKYRRMIKGYHVEPFKKAFPRYVSAIVEETINVKALEGLIKGKLIFEGELKDTGVITETPTYAYYIR